MRLLERKSVLLLCCLALLLIGGAAGYFFRDLSARGRELDSLTADLASNFVVLDAIDARQGEKVRTIIAADIEQDFEAAIRLVWSGEAPPAERLFCEISRRIRVGMEAGQFFASSQETGADINMISSFLKTNCDGRPKRDSWIPAE